MNIFDCAGIPIYSAPESPEEIREIRRYECPLITASDGIRISNSNFTVFFHSAHVIYELARPLEFNRNIVLILK